jgi:Na+(H+)/acetate symporter ActP
MKAQANRSQRIDVVSGPGEEGPIAALDISTVAAHLGLSPTELLVNIAATAPTLSASSAPPRIAFSLHWL